LATTAFVQSAISAVSAGVLSVTAGIGLTGGGTGNVTLAVAANGITNALAAQMPTLTLKGNSTAATTTAQDLTVAQAMTMLNAASLTSPAFNGSPTAPTVSAADSSTKLATTAFVKGAMTGAGVTIGDTAPASPTPGKLWWSSADGQMYVYYQDPTSSQWVVANSAAGIQEAPTDGLAYGRQSATWTQVLLHSNDTLDGGNF
jgi:hypothetical protein